MSAHATASVQVAGAARPPSVTPWRRFRRDGTRGARPAWLRRLQFVVGGQPQRQANGIGRMARMNGERGRWCERDPAPGRGGTNASERQPSGRCSQGGRNAVSLDAYPERHSRHDSLTRFASARFRRAISRQTVGHADARRHRGRARKPTRRRHERWLRLFAQARGTLRNPRPRPGAMRFERLSITRQRSPARDARGGSSLEEAIDEILDEEHVLLGCELDNFLAPRGRHRMPDRVVQDGLQIEGGQGACAMRPGNGVGADPLFIHGDGNNGDAEPAGDALDCRIGDGLDAEAAADRHERRDGRRNRLPAAAREHEPIGMRLPVWRCS